jgi:hypothetical protein
LEIIVEGKESILRRGALPDDHWQVAEVRSTRVAPSSTSGTLTKPKHFWSMGSRDYALALGTAGRRTGWAAQRLVEFYDVRGGPEQADRFRKGKTNQGKARTVEGGRSERIQYSTTEYRIP